jgi:hypothetical protein
MPVRNAAEPILRTHPLRAADSLQLGACIAVFGERRRDRAFVDLDDLLAEAARKEGFTVARCWLAVSPPRRRAQDREPARTPRA